MDDVEDEELLKSMKSFVLYGARGGTVVQTGTLPARVELPANRIMSKEFMVLGSFRSVHAVEEALELIAGNRISAGEIISRVFPFHEFQRAMDATVKREGVIKVQVDI